MKKISKFFKKNESKIIIIFFVIIPIIVGTIAATIGYMDNGFLSALAGFIRFGIYYYSLCFIVYMLIETFKEFKEIILTFMFLGVIGLILASILNALWWLLTNY